MKKEDRQRGLGRRPARGTTAPNNQFVPPFSSSSIKVRLPIKRRFLSRRVFFREIFSGDLFIRRLIRPTIDYLK